MDLLTPTLPFLESLQRFTFLLRPMQFFSALGTEWFYLFLMPLLFWGANRQIAVRLGALLLFSVVVNEIFKAAFAFPRPYWIVPTLQISMGEKSFGFPSGHAQNAFLIWPFLAFQSKNPRLYLPLALLLALLISFSRLFLGVHFPLDVVGGALIGLSILGLGSLGERRWMNFWREMPVATKIAIAVILTLVLSSIYALAYQGIINYVADYTSPSLDAYRATTSGSVMATRLGALFGLLCGLALASKRRDSTKNQGNLIPLETGESGIPTKNEDARFSSRLTPVLRLVIGFAGLLLIYRGLGAVLPKGVLTGFGHYALVTLWIVYLAPSVFERLGWGGRVLRVVDGPG